ncbi:hypothetical protein EVAR_25926_1 [Eumeta japonica]|uniref:Craniofacial development protein 2 n=1 Tax=Eumeta variegata TaxID=151549 RepID=A0A4C1W2X8_EUMVA|nr:hypothetical protein EVAR_25926_1 [Eumeta japonica]
MDSSRPDCGDEVRHLSHLVARRGETRIREVRSGTLNVCGRMDDKIDDVCELMKDRQLDILWMNEFKRKGSGGAIKHRYFEIYWFDVDQGQRRLSECVTGNKCVNPSLLLLRVKID